MSEAEAWEAGRGLWKINRDRLTRQQFVLITGEGIVRAIAEITRTTMIAGRTALEGQLVAAGHPMWDAYFDKPDPIVTESQNPVAYGELPEELELLARPCGCGCGAIGRRDFLPGHDVRAIQARVRANFHSPLEFIRWVDAHVGSTSSMPSEEISEPAIDNPSDVVHGSSRASSNDSDTTERAIVEAVQEIVAQCWLVFDSVGWARLAEAAERRGQPMTSRAKLAHALAGVFGENAPNLVRDRRGAWVYTVTDLWAAVNTWRASRGLNDPLEYCYNRQETKAFIALLHQALNVRHGLDTSSKGRLLVSLRESGVTVPTALRSSFVDVVRRYQDDALTWLRLGPGAMPDDAPGERTAVSLGSSAP
ncbi:hypothetical protein [Amycolatopsis sp. w19]|uniref:hypothetical protein n=1 Tax=Amycolatopsis sp. w19 TaxID=3448134 RepID=UPI003F1B82BD